MKSAPPAAGLAALAQQVPLELMMEHGAMDTLDLLVYLIAFNRTNRFLVLEALAGCGKTSMLTGLVKRLSQKKGVLLLSFTRAAVRVARVRLRDEGVKLMTQTFDSLIYHAVRFCLGEQEESEVLDFQTYRELSQYICVDQLHTFECRAWVRYDLKDVQYILVDEAQDTPPEALTLLRQFRDMGKTVIITGDRNQAIFQFMNTQSLFDTIRPHEKVTHTLRRTRRCGYHIAQYVNRRFALQMIPTTLENDPGPTTIKTVCVQARSNRTLARLYAQMLFALGYQCKVYVAKNESETVFWETLVEETAARYSLTPEAALMAIHDRQENQDYFDAVFIFSTTHHFKGGECDVTVLADDLCADEPSDSAEEERVKYTACTRARWGIVDLHDMRYHGHPRARALMSELVASGRAFTGTNSIACIGTLALCQIQLVLCPSLTPLLDECRRLCKAAPAALAPTAADAEAEAEAEADRALYRRLSGRGGGGGGGGSVSVHAVVKTLAVWEMERRARRAGARCFVASPEFRVDIFHDRRYKAMVREDMVELGVHRRLRRRMAQLKLRAAMARFLVVNGHAPLTAAVVVDGAVARAVLRNFIVSHNVTRLKPVPLTLKRMMRAYCRRTIPAAWLTADTVLQAPGEWRELHLHQAISQGALEMQGCIDAVVVDSQHRWHLYDFRTTRAAPSVHLVLQTMVAAACVALNHGFRLHRAVIYNLSDGGAPVLEVTPAFSARHLGQHPEGANAMNDAMRWKIAYQYYKSSRDEALTMMLMLP